MPSDWQPKVVPKDEAAVEFLKECMATNRLMKNLAPSDREQLMLAFELVRGGESGHACGVQ